jgi:hypothetical protein
MSSVYLAMWLYIGSTLVNVVGAVVLIGVRDDPSETIASPHQTDAICGNASLPLPV